MLKFRHPGGNPFLANVSILYHLKAPENVSFSGVVKGIKWEHLPELVNIY